MGSPRSILSTLRHELRTPLNAVIGYSEMLLEDVRASGKADRIAELEKLRTAGRELLCIVNEILNPSTKDGVDDKCAAGGGEAGNYDDLFQHVRVIEGCCATLIAGSEKAGEEDFVSDITKIRSASKTFLARIDAMRGLLSAMPTAPGPGEPSRAAVRRSMPGTGEKHSSGAAAPGSILVVDDNELNRDLLKRSLERQGHRVTVAENGLLALGMMRERAFDLVLLDVMMPGMSGDDVLRRLKSSEEWRHLPVIMISALDEMDSVVRCIELGAEDYLPKPFDPVLLRARTDACLEKKRLRDVEIEQKRELSELNRALEVRNQFLRKIFGRYLSDEVVRNILETPDGLKFGGEKRNVTIMMADLRGFTSLSEQVSPEAVVDILSVFYETMTDIVLKYEGTINEFIGDGILVLFGAPLAREDHAIRAVACAVEMQLAMDAVNERVRHLGAAPISMGIGINTGNVVVGNVGSSKRATYTAIGRHVNLAARIESFTVGGQVLVSESTLEACGGLLRIDDRKEIAAKGVKDAVPIYDIGGVAGTYGLALPEKKQADLPVLKQSLPLSFAVLDGKQVATAVHAGALIRLRGDEAVIRAETVPENFKNIRICFEQCGDVERSGDLYAKVIGTLPGTPPEFTVCFTSISPDGRLLLDSLATQ